MSDTEDNATTESAKTITAINKDTVHKICSGQVNETYTHVPIHGNGILFFSQLTSHINTYTHTNLY